MPEFCRSLSRYSLNTLLLFCLTRATHQARSCNQAGSSALRLNRSTGLHELHVQADQSVHLFGCSQWGLYRVFQEQHEEEVELRVRELVQGSVELQEDLSHGPCLKQSAR